MHIGFITPEYPHVNTGTSGGIGTSLRNLALALSDLGHNVTVFVYGQPGDTGFNDNGLNIIQIKNVKLKGLSWYLTRKKIQKKINDKINNFGVQIVEAPDWMGITAFMALKCPLVIKLHGSDTFFCYLDKRPVKFMNFFFEKNALKTADAHISVSTYVAKTTGMLFNLNLNYKIIPNGIKIPVLDGFKELQQENKYYHTLLSVGTLIRKKGVLEIPLIFNEIIKTDRSVQLIIIGRDSYDNITGSSSTWNLMKSLFTEVALSKVNYIGEVSYDNLNHYYSSADVCIYPSHAESFGLVTIEGMSLGKPVICYDYEWTRELISDKIDGFLIEPHNYVRFAEQVHLLLNDNELRNRIGTNARTRVIQNFSSEIVANKTLAFYRKVIASHK